MATMKAMVYMGPGRIVFDSQRPKPTLQHAADAIIRITHTTLCGTDLHILRGNVPEVKPGTVLGHEAVGCVESVGEGVTTVHPGETVVVSCVAACTRCSHCKREMYSHCSGGGGWLLGRFIDGTHAEYVRVPLADGSLHRIPAGSNAESMTLLSDIFPTGLECGVLKGKVEPGCSVAIVGAGPVGLATVMTANLYSPAMVIVVDLDDHRLQVARSLGATHVFNSRDSNVVEKIKAVSGGEGVDVAIEAVGIPATFDVCQQIIAPGGVIANVGVHGKKVDLHLDVLWSRNISITTRLVDTTTTPMLMRLIGAGKLDPSKLITHRFTFDQFPEAYDVFGKASESHALKVVVHAAQ